MAYGLDPANWALLILVGCVVGFVGGLLGVSGGFVVVPSLMAILSHLGVATADIPKVIAITSLALLIPTSIASSQAHLQKAGIDWSLWALLTPSVITGAIAAATFANMIDARVITCLFISVLFLSAARLLRGKNPQAMKTEKIDTVGLTIKTVAGGFLAGLLGISVAMFCVPMLSRFISVPKAIGTASALALPLALAGIATHLLITPSSACGPTCAGFIFLPALAAIGLTSVLTAPLGVKAAQVLPVRTLQTLFAFILITSAGHLALKTFASQTLIMDAKTLVAEMIVKPWRGENAQPATPFFESRSEGRIEAHMYNGSR